jgi:hypothetical protein
MLFFLPVSDTWPSHLTLLDLIISIIFNTEYGTCVTYWYCFLYTKLTYAFVGLNDFVNTFFYTSLPQ